MYMATLSLIEYDLDVLKVAMTAPAPVYVSSTVRLKDTIPSASVFSIVALASITVPSSESSIDT